MRTCRPPNFGYSCGRWAAWQSFLDSWLPAVCQCYFSSRNGLKSSLCEAEGQQQKLPGTGTFQVDFFPEEKAYTKPGHFLCASASLPDRKGHLVCSLLQACAPGKFCKTLLDTLFHWWRRPLDKKVFYARSRCLLGESSLLSPSAIPTSHDRFEDRFAEQRLPSTTFVTRPSL